MKWLGLFCMAVAASPWMQGADEHQILVGPASASVKSPPVLRIAEPRDDVVVTLPGSVAPAAAAGPTATEVRLAPPLPDTERPLLRRPKREYPLEYERDSAEYLGHQIGIWEQMDALNLLGDPLRQRSAFGDDQTVNGQIMAFLDPSGRYKEVELDFDRKTGLLRSLFVYPYSMTWQDCRRNFGSNVRPAQANKGRTFYSYMDRRLDVLVDGAGKVISLGMY